MTDNPDQRWVAEARRQGARIVQADFDIPEKIVAHRFWRRMNRLYLLSADPSTNLVRLSVINQRLVPIATRRRIPLIVRIDDPWLAEAWRAQQFGNHAPGSDHLWAADTASKYEATARRLIAQVLDKKTVRQIIVCGSSQLTLALCAEVALRHTERRFHAPEGQPELPELTLVAPDADEYVSDHAARHSGKRLDGGPPTVDAVTAVPSAAEVSRLVEQVAERDRHHGGDRGRLGGRRRPDPGYAAGRAPSHDADLHVGSGCPAEHRTLTGCRRAAHLPSRNGTARWPRPRQL